MKSQTIFGIRSEWDLGVEGIYFLTKEAAQSYMEQDPIVLDLIRMEGNTFEELADQGLLYVHDNDILMVDDAAT